MAAECALAVVGKIAEMTVDPVVRQFSYIFCYNQNIQTLRKQLAELEARRDDVQLSKAEAERNLEIVNRTVESWLNNVDGITREAMEVLDGTSSVKKGCLNGWCPNLKHRYMLSRKATKRTVDIGQLKVEANMFFKFAHSAVPQGIVSPGVASIAPKDDAFKGFATRIATMNEVMDALKDEKINLIGISGMGGVGKTTLVDQVIEKVKAERLFDEVAKAEVTQKPDLIKIQGVIAVKLGLKFDDGWPIDARAERLCERLKKGGRALIVLDDIWEGINLGEVGIPAGNGCKVVFTTREERTCTEMAAQRHVVVQFLSDQEALDLFREAVGDCIENVDLRDIAKEVAKECGGLPIAVVTLGKALSKRDKCEWEDTLLRLKKSSGMEEKVKSCIMSSYDFLKSRRPNAQPLLLLCSLFEEDENIKIEQLVIYSIGLELFDDVETLEETRNRVHTLVKNLKSCNLLLQGDLDNDLCVKLHDVVRDVCLIIASKPPHAYLVPRDLNLKQWPGHNKQKAHTAIAIKSGALNELPGGLDYPNLRLLQLKLKHENINIAKDFFQGMRGIQVFSFEGYRSWRSNVILPPTLKLLTNLQALSLEFCNLVGDASSIGCLKGLKILSFFRSQLDEFPREVWELKNLKLLDLRLLHPNIGKFVLSGMDQLEVLYMGDYASWAKNSEENNEENSTSITELKSLPSLTTLQLRVSKSMILLELEESFFERLKRFNVSIRLRCSWGEYGIIKNSISQKGDLSLLSHTKLHSLVRKTQYLNLKRCEDEGSFIDEADSARYAFHNLETLEIRDMDDLTEISKIPDGSFPKLQELSLSYLSALRHLWSGPIQPPSLGNLRVLKIDFCDSIEYLFSSSVAKCLVQLKVLNIFWCSELEGVISYDGGDDAKEIEKIEFPKLNYLGLNYLEILKSFSPERGNEDLEGDCGTVQSLLNQRVSFPNLDEMEIRGLSTLEKVVGSQMQDGPANKLRILRIFDCKNLKNFVDSPTLQNLEDVEISDCKSMEAVFDLEGLKVEGGNAPFIFDKLKSIRLNRLYGLTHVWRMPPENIQGFRNLRTFIAKRCIKLRYLLTESMAKMLVNLQVLKVDFCSNIVVMIEGDDEGCFSEPRSKESIVFPQLKVLRLDSLHGFTSFCSSKYSFEFPLLDEVTIHGCPEMKTFCSGAVNAPVLEEPVEDPEGGQWFWEGNLNNGIYRERYVSTCYDPWQLMLKNEDFL